MNLIPKEQQKNIYANPEEYSRQREERRRNSDPDAWRADPDSWVFDDKETYLSWKNGDIDLSDYLEEGNYFPDDSIKTTPENEFEDNNLTAKQFFDLDFRYSQYLLYRYLQKIELSLQSIYEVLSDGTKTR